MKLLLPFHTEPGESLIASINPYTAETSREKYSETTGLNEFHTFQVSPLIIPRKTDRITASPEVLWHPVFWLPDNLAEPFESETEDLWGLRIAWTLQGNQLYNPEDATWKNALEPLGIDLTTAEGINRIKTWQAGSDDPELDTYRISLPHTQGDYFFRPALAVFDDTLFYSLYLKTEQLASNLNWAESQPNLELFNILGSDLWLFGNQCLSPEITHPGEAVLAEEHQNITARYQESGPNSTQEITQAMQSLYSSTLEFYSSGYQKFAQATESEEAFSNYLKEADDRLEKELQAL